MDAGLLQFALNDFEFLIRNGSQIFSEQGTGFDIGPAESLKKGSGISTALL